MCIHRVFGIIQGYNQSIESEGNEDKYSEIGRVGWQIGKARIQDLLLEGRAQGLQKKWC